MFFAYPLVGLTGETLHRELIDFNAKVAVLAYKEFRGFLEQTEIDTTL